LLLVQKYISQTLIWHKVWLYSWLITCSCSSPVIVKEWVDWKKKRWNTKIQYTWFYTKDIFILKVINQLNFNNNKIYKSKTDMEFTFFSLKIYFLYNSLLYIYGKILYIIRISFKMLWFIEYFVLKYNTMLI
jgi:hypothetical protein